MRLLNRLHMSGLSRGPRLRSSGRDDVRRSLFGVTRALLGFALFCAPLCAHPRRAESLIKVDWKQGRLSVDAENAELSHVLREVAQQTGIEILGAQDIGQLVSIHLSDVSLQKALKALLDGQDYAVLGDISSPQKARTAQVVVLGGLAAPDSNRNSLSDAAGSGAPAERAVRIHRNRRSKEEEGSDPDRAAAAIEAAAAKADVESLAKTIKGSDPTLQAQAFEELYKLNPHAALSALNSELQSDQPTQRLQALELLDQFDQADNDTIISALGQALKADDPSLKDYAIQALARRGGSQELELLRQALGDPDPAVRFMVVETVGRRLEALSLLQHALSDSDPSVSAAASQLLKAAGQASQPPN